MSVAHRASETALGFVVMLVIRYERPFLELDDSYAHFP